MKENGFCQRESVEGERERKRGTGQRAEAQDQKTKGTFRGDEIKSVEQWRNREYQNRTKVAFGTEGRLRRR